MYPNLYFILWMNSITDLQMLVSIEKGGFDHLESG